MGICVSADRSDCESSPTAKIVSVNGNLRDYNIPVLASEVLEAESEASSSSSSSSRSDSYFICNSDSLCYEDFIPALKPDDLLQPNQIYFVLPNSKRQIPLSASDMAAMAVKASMAIQNSAGKMSRRRKNGRISPMMALSQSNDHIAINEREATRMFSETTAYKRKLASKTTPFKAASFSRSNSVRRLQRYTTRRAKLAVRSFRLRLSTIPEGVVL